MAVLSVTVPDSAVSRIRNAVAVSTGVAAPASLAQVQDWCKERLRDLCLQVEQASADQQAKVTVGTDFP